MNTLIKLAGEMPELSLLPDKIQARDGIVQVAKSIVAVTDAVTQKTAVEIGSHLRKMIKSVEAARKEVKQPFREKAELCVRLAEEFSKPLEAELQRLERLVTQFQRQEAERVEADRQRREAEIKRLEEERHRAEEAARLAAQEMQSEADLAKAIAAEAEAKAREADAYNRIASALPSAQRERGMQTRKVTKYLVTDIDALCDARRDLVRIEPNLAAIRATVFVGMIVPGLKVWEEIESILKAT